MTFDAIVRLRASKIVVMYNTNYSVARREITKNVASCKM
jgi:hypothetical protein